ncbi:SSI family serine proteinase inhibitor [Actinomadura parmotrematis]|uniref:Subtilase-type protease inhibitor n=1 Tax=Actinomadura parmotrematis TaxID=2864039 RepID=A0ABS7FU31_9ACTN|nr:SSI family serine proteinase inhibitor [Actinomadura parmotrematis]MBW8483913.1 subtilase-type protease inhibitor [Actinomadura parmotrematis]
MSTARRLALVPLLVAAGSVAVPDPAPATAAGRAAAAAPVLAAAPRAAGRLDITVDHLRPGLPRVRWTLDCGRRDTGFHTDPAAACSSLRALPAPFAGPGRGTACTQVVAGPQRATVTGTWRGRRVALRVARTDGCQERVWQRLRPVLDPAGPCLTTSARPASCPGA